MELTTKKKKKKGSGHRKSVYFSWSDFIKTAQTNVVSPPASSTGIQAHWCVLKDSGRI